MILHFFGANSYGCFQAVNAVVSKSILNLLASDSFQQRLGLESQSLDISAYYGPDAIVQGRALTEDIS